MKYEILECKEPFYIDGIQIVKGRITTLGIDQAKRAEEAGAKLSIVSGDKDNGEEIKELHKQIKELNEKLANCKCNEEQEAPSEEEVAQTELKKLNNFNKKDLIAYTKIEEFLTPEQLHKLTKKEIIKIYLDELKETAEAQEPKDKEEA